MRGILATLGIQPDVILVSTARRTMQTLEALEPWADTPLTEPMDSLYLASAEHLLEALRAVPETVRSVMLIGHNPGLHELARVLLGDQAEHPADEAARAVADGYPTGALAEFSVGGRWADLGEGGTRLERFIDPREIESTSPS